ncbi:hypothetical protein J437_LFUL014459 [Ladona fulva]|uniref:non-specific serine/threonine protein kinase n=1 Tax=Ladona fulva TaxID=123851 RepID=A0A8K0KGX0_LADFU|nr:hypothetical protein J437_LFUL014459 [Ladona fulva]
MENFEGFEKVRQGAEARIYVGKYLGKLTLVKERFEKKYRHPDLDASLTKDRIKAEIRAIMRCKIAGIPTPAIYLVDLERRSIFMEYIKGLTVKEYVEKSEAEFSEIRVDGRGNLNNMLHQLGLRIGHIVARMHCSNIIHGDLTSSNILICPGNCDGGSELEEFGIDELMVTIRDSLCRSPSNQDYKLVIIDFGLGKTDSSAEDKGVDLYVLERALLSTHPKVAPKTLFPAIMKGYTDKCGKSAPEVIAKLDEIRMRGRKRTMVG